MGIEKIFNFSVFGYGFFGLALLLSIENVIPFSPDILLILHCYGNFMLALASPGANTKELENVSIAMIGTSSSVINFIIGIIPGAFLLLSNVFFEETFFSYF